MLEESWRTVIFWSSHFTLCISLNLSELFHLFTNRRFKSSRTLFLCFSPALFQIFFCLKPFSLPVAGHNPPADLCSLLDSTGREWWSTFSQSSRKSLPDLCPITPFHSPHRPHSRFEDFSWFCDRWKCDKATLLTSFQKQYTLYLQISIIGYLGTPAPTI